MMSAPKPVDPPDGSNVDLQPLGPCGPVLADVHSIRFWSLERATAQDSYLLALTTEHTGRHTFRLQAVDILALASFILDDRERSANAAPVQ